MRLLHREEAALGRFVALADVHAVAVVARHAPRRPLFLTHLDDLRCRPGQFRKLHVSCDKLKFHNCCGVLEYLAWWQGRIELHFLRRYAPETSPLERVWWQLHEIITRNHRCRTVDELLRETYQWAAAQGTFFDHIRSFRTIEKTRT